MIPLSNVLLLPVDTWHSSHCKEGDWELMRDSRNIQRSKKESDSLSETSRSVWSKHSRASERERGPRTQRRGQSRKLKQKITDYPDMKEQDPQGWEDKTYWACRQFVSDCHWQIPRSDCQFSGMSTSWSVTCGPVWWRWSCWSRTTSTTRLGSRRRSRRIIHARGMTEMRCDDKNILISCQFWFTAG